MKLDTIISRGTKRDFVDIYFLANKFSLEKMLSFYQKKYSNLGQRKLMIKKSLVFFEEADEDEMPNMLEEIDWKKVKKWFQKEVSSL